MFVCVTWVFEFAIHEKFSFYHYKNACLTYFSSEKLGKISLSTRYKFIDMVKLHQCVFSCYSVEKVSAYFSKIIKVKCKNKK